MEQVELRVQGVWCCVYGLLERTLIRQLVPAYRDKAIEEVLGLIMASLRPHEAAQEAEQLGTQAYDRDSITIYKATCGKRGNEEQMKILIIYKSKYGTEEEVVAYLRQKLCADLQEADPALSWEGHEHVVCIEGIYADRLAKQLLTCIRANTKELAGKSVGMLLCGMSDAAPEKIITGDLGEARCRQLAFSVNIGGRLDSQKLDFLEGKIVRMVNKQERLYEGKDAVLVGHLRWDTIDSVIAEQTHGA